MTKKVLEKTCWEVSRDWTEATVLGLKQDEQSSRETKCIGLGTRVDVDGSLV